MRLRYLESKAGSVRLIGEEPRDFRGLNIVVSNRLAIGEATWFGAILVCRTDDKRRKPYRCVIRGQVHEFSSPPELVTFIRGLQA